MAEKACIIGAKRDDPDNKFIDEVRTALHELERAGVPTVVEHEWWKHPVWHRGNDTKFVKMGDYIFTVDYSSHEAEDEEGIYYTHEMCISKEVVPAAKERIAKEVQDIKSRFRGDPYFEGMAKRLEEFLGKV